VTFVDVDVFGRTAENVGQYMRKGRPILIEGRLRLDQWTTSRPGRRRASLGSSPKTFNFSAARPAVKVALRRPRPARPAAAAAPGAPAAEPVEGDGPPESDDVPF